MKFELFVALRYLIARRKTLFAVVTTGIAIGGVTVGVTALNVTLAVMNGFHQDIQDKILGIQSHIVALLQSGGETPQDLKTLEDTIRHTQGVKAAAPFVLGQVLLRHGTSVSGAVLKGITPQEENRLSQIERFMKVGTWSSLENPQKKGIIVGLELARAMGLQEGDSVFIVPPSGAVSMLGLMPKIEEFQVAGIFESGYYEYDSNLAYIELSQAQRLFSMPGRITGFGIALDSLQRLPHTARELKEHLGHKLWVRSWQDLNRPLFSALKLEKIVMFLILIMIVLVASSNIISNLLLITLEKTRDIGILKALGTSRWRIRRLFILEGTLIGVVGVILGSLLGLGICLVLDRTHWIKLPADVYYLSSLPISIAWQDVGLVALSALAITILATFYPAAKAARIEPMSAIRTG